MNKLANIRKPILICGESGTGKSYLARELHEESDYSQTPFIVVNLASLSENLIESELFGHVKGAFTGAISNKKGHLESVGHGTLFLDEVGELSLNAQKKLLFLLEEKLFCPVGGTQLIQFKGRIIAATNKNLKEMVRERSFREDLYYRLNVFTLETTPLRENSELLEKQVYKLFDKISSERGGRPGRINEKLYEKLIKYPWYGNIRELKNCIEYLVYMSESNEYTVGDLPGWMESEENRENESYSLSQYAEYEYKRALEEFEEKFLRDALCRYQGKINLTSKMLNMNKTTLIAKVRKYGINSNQIKADVFQKSGSFSN